MNNMDEKLLLENATNAFRQMGLTTVVQKRESKVGNKQPDAVISVKKGKSTIKYIVELKKTVTPATLGTVVGQLRQNANGSTYLPLLITNHVTVPMAETLRGLGQQFVDGSGNAFIEGSEILVWVVGRKPADKSLQARQSNMFTPTNLKVLFALICDPELANSTYRGIAISANVALGAITPALSILQTQGYMAVIKRNRRLIPTRKLLDEWTLAYAQVIRPKHLLGTFTSPTFDEWQKWDIESNGAQWGGEPAAQQLVRHLKPGILTLYADKVPGPLVVKQRLTKAEADTQLRTVEVRKRFWGIQNQDNAKSRIVPPALIYADLLATGEGRCIETAHLIYNKYLVRLFPQI